MKIPALLTPEETLQKMISDVNNYAAIYARRSIITENGSLDVQIKSCMKYAAQNNLIVFKTYSEAISATSNSINERKALSDMLEDAKNGLFKNLIVSKRDRLARIFEDYLSIKKQLNKLGINIYFSDEATYIKNNDPMANFIDNILMVVADFEPSRIKEKTEAGRKTKKDAGEYTCNRIPYGYIKSKDKININERYCHSFSCDEDIKPIIQKIYSNYINNPEILSPNNLYDFLIDNQIIKTDIDVNLTYRILTNPVYAGLMTVDNNIKYNFGKLIDKKSNIELPLDKPYFKKCCNITNPPVEVETWFKAIKKLNSNHTSKVKTINNTNDIFKDLVYCKICNNKVALRGNYYHCTCKGISIHKAILKNSVINYLFTSDISKEFLTQYIDKIIKKLNIEKDTTSSAFKKCLEKIKYATDNYILSPTEHLQKEILNLSKEKEALAKQLSNIKQQLSLLKTNSQKLDVIKNDLK